jgi:hypothetical protein
VSPPSCAPPPAGVVVAGADARRWAAVLDDPELLAELRDYFLLAQLQAQASWWAGEL